MSADHPTAHTVPHPVLFNAWKHHASWVREQIDLAATAGEDGLKSLAEAVVVCGTKLMDFYLGTLTPWELGDRALAHMKRVGKSDFPSFREWLDSQGGFAAFEVPDDGSTWIFRAGDAADRYVHLHPGRYSPHTVRVFGISLKTAIVTLAFAEHTGADPLAVGTVNDARKRYLGLPPVAAVDPANGLGEVLRMLGA